MKVRLNLSPFKTLAPGANPASYTMGTGYFPGVKRLGRDFNLHPQIAPRLKRVELYLYSPYGPSWPVIVWILPLPLPL